MQRGHEREPAACKSKKQEGKDRKGEEATKGNKEGSEKERKWKNECHESWHCMWSCKQTPQQTVCWTHNYKPEVRGKEKITVTQRDYRTITLTSLCYRIRLHINPRHPELSLPTSLSHSVQVHPEVSLLQTLIFFLSHFFNLFEYGNSYNLENDM